MKFKKILCKLFGHQFDRTAIIYNQIKLPTQKRKTLTCERCNYDDNNDQTKIGGKINGKI
jgi:hypothetical protein